MSPHQEKKSIDLLFSYSAVNQFCIYKYEECSYYGMLFIQTLWPDAHCQAEEKRRRWAPTMMEAINLKDAVGAGVSGKS